MRAFNNDGEIGRCQCGRHCRQSTPSDEAPEFLFDNVVRGEGLLEEGCIGRVLCRGARVYGLASFGVEADLVDVYLKRMVC